MELLDRNQQILVDFALKVHDKNGVSLSVELIPMRQDHLYLVAWQVQSHLQVFY